MTYFVVLEGLDVLDPVSVLGEVDVADDPLELLGGVVRVVESLGSVLGEAEGEVRSAPPTRSLRSVQPASTPTPRARTQKPVKNLLIVIPPRGFGREVGAATAVPPTYPLRYASRLAKRGHSVKEKSP